MSYAIPTCRWKYVPLRNRYASPRLPTSSPRGFFKLLRKTLRAVFPSNHTVDMNYRAVFCFCFWPVGRYFVDAVCFVNHNVNYTYILCEVILSYQIPDILFC